MTSTTNILPTKVATKVAQALIAKAAAKTNDSIAYHGSTQTARDALRRLIEADGTISKYLTGTFDRDVMMSDLDYSAHAPHDFNAAAWPTMHEALSAIRAAILVLDC